MPVLQGLPSFVYVISLCTRLLSSRCASRGKRDFLDLLGMTVFVGKRPDRYHELDWDAKLRLPELESILHDADFCISYSKEDEKPKALPLLASNMVVIKKML